VIGCQVWACPRDGCGHSFFPSRATNHVITTTPGKYYSRYTMRVPLLQSSRSGDTSLPRVDPLGQTNSNITSHSAHRRHLRGSVTLRYRSYRTIDFATTISDCSISSDSPALLRLHPGFHRQELRGSTFCAMHPTA
jgi:hypothetical protein